MPFRNREKGSWASGACESDGAPQTCAALSALAALTAGGLSSQGQIKFSLLRPGTHILPHTGPTNARLRLHLGLRVPPPELGRFTLRVAAEPAVEWAEGEVLILDDSFEHELWASNSTDSEGCQAREGESGESEEEEGSAARLILIVDLDHPELGDRGGGG